MRQRRLHPPWHFDIDRYLNRLVPPPPWSHIPEPVAWFLGHRAEPTQNIGTLAPVFWAFIGVFCSLSIIQVVDLHIPDFESREVPIIIGSFGAAAVLEFYSIEAALAQPRNAVLGQLISALVGVAVCKLFLLSDNFAEYQWAGGALACAAATCLMALTKTVHPPAGATALLAVVDDKVVKLGWFLLPVMMLGCGLMLVVALIINNIERRFPVYWWTPESLERGHKEMVERKPSAEESEREVDMEAGGVQSSGEEGRAEGGTEGMELRVRNHDKSEIIIRRGQVVIPESLQLRQEELAYLEALTQRI